MNTEKIVFDNIDKITVPVSIAGTDYELLEADGGAITERDNAIINGTVMKDGKPVQILNIAGIDAVLLSRCLIDVKKGVKVPLRTIEAWPNRVKDVLTTRLKEISGITDDEPTRDAIEDAVGNSSSENTDGSS
jgi:hypothetical protein